MTVPRGTICPIARILGNEDASVSDDKPDQCHISVYELRVMGKKTPDILEFSGIWINPIPDYRHVMSKPLVDHAV
ncbi:MULTISPECIES: hypothetical protein [Asaia]|uniref:hypothetical protein n=1 Tax=Asaia TaxID=91914 RepID=UPI001267C50B|nr:MULTISPECIES: hypothetical protein [Asaia]